VVEENEITNNWTVGVLFNTLAPEFPTSSIAIHNNNISGNWYGQIVRRWNELATLDMSGNWLGTNNPVKVTGNSSEPGYAAQIPTSLGGTATPPATPAADIYEVNTPHRVDYSPWLDSGTDISPEYGFQGDYSNLHVDADSPQAGPDGRISEALALLTSVGTIHVRP